MSEHFIQEFKKQNKCRSCKTERCRVGRRVYAMCYGHLTKARLLYYDWKTDRQAAGLCVHCNNPVGTYSDGRLKTVCVKHLEDARKSWQKNSRRRMKSGLCVHYRCRGMPVKNEQRCKRHKHENQLRCLVWIRDHKDHQDAAWRRRKELYLDKGFCICKAHTPLPAGQRRCNRCRKNKYAS